MLRLGLSILGGTLMFLTPVSQCSAEQVISVGTTQHILKLGGTSFCDTSAAADDQIGMSIRSITEILAVGQLLIIHAST